MKRRLVLGILVSVGMLSIGVAAFQAPSANPGFGNVVDIKRIQGNLYMATGGGGNSAVFITNSGVVVVDTKLPGWGQPLIDAIKLITDKPVTTIINTHTHGDHVSGNVEFPANVNVIAHANTAENMKAMRPAASIPQNGPPRNIFQENGGKGLPKQTFTTTLTVGSGNDRVELRYFGRAHTNGDAWVVFPALRVAHAGDAFAGKTLPLLDTNNGGSGVEIPATLDKAAAALGPRVDMFITGHSVVMSLDDLKQYAQFNHEFANYVTAGKKAGKSVDDLTKEWKLAQKYVDSDYPPVDQARLRFNIEAVYNETK